MILSGLDLLRRALPLLALALGLTLAAAMPAEAQSLEELKAQGLVGERPDGFLGIVPSTVPAGVVSTVDRINAERRQAYAEIAAQNGTSVEAVGIVTAEKLYAKAAPGHYLMNKSGQWVKK